MKNLDKPLSIGIVSGADFWSQEFNDYHGTEYKNWAEVVNEIMNATDSPSPIPFYEKYLEWCKVANSPLMRALR